MFSINDYTLTPARIVSIEVAIALGADDATLTRIAEANRLARSATIVLPRSRFETISRGDGWCRGWCRCGRGDNVARGQREDAGYRVGPGKWNVHGSDGFRRNEEIAWTVTHIQVGTQTWTIAT